MIRGRFVASFASVAMLVAAPPARAQNWEQAPREGACFYQDANYEGRSFCATAGDDYKTIPNGMNDNISSIKILGGAEVTVYKDTKLRGDSERFNRNVRNLRDDDWNDKISSLSVDRRYGSGGGYRPPPGHSYGNPDQIIRRAYEDVLDRQPDQAGLRLYRSRIIDDGWTESDVRDALRKSPEYREKTTMTWPKAQEIVRRAYLNVLRREPDSGSRGYVEKVMQDKWTQQDVERELRRSPEYRK